MDEFKSINEESKYFNDLSELLIGRKIIQVFYQELNYQDNKEYWQYSNEIHSVDMNMIFELDNQNLIQIYWDNEFYSYGIGVLKIDKVDESENIKTINLSQNSNWIPQLNSELKNVDVHWATIEGIRNEFEDKKLISKENLEVKMPETLEIQFSNNRSIWISAFEIKENSEENYYGADHLTIFFTKKSIERFKLLDNNYIKYQ